jgi:hypothetical protein
MICLTWDYLWHITIILDYNEYDNIIDYDIFMISPVSLTIPIPFQITIHGTRSPGGHAPGARTRLATAQAPDAGGAG